jgi:hypothetical protein
MLELFIGYTAAALSDPAALAAGGLTALIIACLMPRGAW